MIKNTELRIGNIFLDEDQNPCYFAGAWENQEGWLMRDSANNSYKELQMYPIPLTPKILEKCGFRWYDSVWYEIKGIIHLSVELGTGYIYFGKGEYLFKSNVTNLHQLQNLYFALTGAELIFSGIIN